MNKNKGNQHVQVSYSISAYQETQQKGLLHRQRELLLCYSKIISSITLQQMHQVECHGVDPEVDERRVARAVHVRTVQHVQVSRWQEGECRRQGWEEISSEIVVRVNNDNCDFRPNLQYWICTLSKGWRSCLNENIV